MPELQICYHDHCFDGVASAATFLRFYREKVRKVDDVSLKGMAHRAGPLFGPDAFAGEENAVVDFRFSADPRLTWWFDHHQSAFETPADQATFEADSSGRKFWDPAAKSCTRFLARVVQEKFGWNPEPLRELIACAADFATLYTVSVTRGPARAKISLGSNPWRQGERRHNLAKIAERYGGGGHPAVAAISFPPDQLDRARNAASVIAAELRR